VDSNTFAAAQTHSAVELVVGLAWPVVVIIVAVIFRSQVLGLLAKLSRFKGFGVEAEFDTKLAEVADTLATTTTPAIAGRAAGMGTAQRYGIGPRVRDREARRHREGGAGARGGRHLC
jgi:hypothetical protein